MRNAGLARRVILAAAVAVASGPAGAAERPWVEVRSPHFAVVSNAGGEGDARGVAWQFEQARSVFQALWPWALQDERRPFVVLVARDKETLRRLAPEFWERGLGDQTTAVYVSGREADFVALRGDVESPFSDVRVNPYRRAFEGYAHNVLVRHFPARMPLWYAEGLREVFGNTIVREKDVQVGRAMFWHLDTLTGGRGLDSLRAPGEIRATEPLTSVLLPLTRLIAMERDDPEYTSESGRRLFAAQSWALVHYLMFGEGGIHRAKFNRIADLLREGRSGDEATATALGDVAVLAAGYRAYVRERVFQYLRVDVDVRVAKERWEARGLPPAESDAIQAAFHVAMGHPVTPPPAGAAAALAPRPAPPASGSGDSLIAACNGGDDSACGRLAPALQAACDSGDAPMCMPLAWLHMNGRGVPRDMGKAESLYARACDAGEAKACATLTRIRATAEKK